jgi:hypothetical protein
MILLLLASILLLMIRIFMMYKIRGDKFYIVSLFKRYYSISYILPVQINNNDEAHIKNLKHRANIVLCIFYITFISFIITVAVV